MDLILSVRNPGEVARIIEDTAPLADQESVTPQGLGILVHGQIRHRSRPVGSETFGDRDSFDTLTFEMDSMRAAYDEVYVYTMGRPAFILQHVVDAFAAQTASESSKPIGPLFALVGLYLHVEEHFSGRQVQQAHQELGRRKRKWPLVQLPKDRGSITVSDVLAVPEGPDRDRAIGDWCRAVWAAFSENRPMIIGLLHKYEIISRE